MVELSDFKDISPKPLPASYSADQITAGLPISKTARITLFSEGEWEAFVEEWASSLKGKYFTVKRFSGAGDKGIDVAGFLTDTTFSGRWNNYQCKHYRSPLRPSDIWLEIGKVVYYSFIKEYTVPNRYYFLSPKGFGTTVTRLLSTPATLRSRFLEVWDEHCR